MTQEVLNQLQSSETGSAGTETGDPPENSPAPLTREALEGERNPPAPAGHPPLTRGAGRGPLEEIGTVKPPSLEGGRRDPETPGPGESEAPQASFSPDPTILSHLAGLRRQEAELQREVPDFNLRDALRDTDFLRLTSPTVGVSVRRAYFALHGAEMERRAAEESARRLAASLASSAGRPREGGGQSGAALTAADYRSMSQSQRQDIKRRIIAAAAKGEKVYP